jgi:hypothetical protein
VDLSAKELDRQLLEIVGRVITKFAKDKKKWFVWDRSELLTDGYSDRVVAKARQYDQKQAVTGPITSVCLFSSMALGHPKWWFISVPLIVLCLALSAYRYQQYKYWRTSYSDDLLILDELKEKLGPNFEKSESRPFLWRLDAFLSRKSVNSAKL